jgi:4-diphosphocytidyl-2-C-methyl-D-erythritol kinase
MHLIDSVIAKISLYDDLQLEITSEPGITVAFDFTEPFSWKLDISPQDNTLSRAYDALSDAVGAPLPGMRIRVIKRIPVGSGLGGGSSDAAGLLRLIRDLAGDDSEESAQLRTVKSLTDIDWMALAAQVGADVPAFMVDGPVRAKGFGEDIEPVALRGLEEYECALHFPGIELSTAEMYAKVVEYSTSNHTEAFLAQWHKNGSQAAFALARNDFTPVARDACPEVRAILDSLDGEGYLMVAVSGSGSAVFGILHRDQRKKGKAALCDFLV